MAASSIRSIFRLIFILLHLFFSPLNGTLAATEFKFLQSAAGPERRAFEIRLVRLYSSRLLVIRGPVKNVLVAHTHTHTQKKEPATTDCSSRNSSLLIRIDVPLLSRKVALWRLQWLNDHDSIVQTLRTFIGDCRHSADLQ